MQCQCNYSKRAVSFWWVDTKSQQLELHTYHSYSEKEPKVVMKKTLSVSCSLNKYIYQIDSNNSILDFSF